MLHSLVGELVNWVYETTDDYAIVMSLSKYLRSQGELSFEDAGSELSSVTEALFDWT